MKDASLRQLVIAALILGLVVPPLEQVPLSVIPITLAIVIFFTGFRFKFSDFRGFTFKGILLGYFARFFLFPIFIYFVLALISPRFAEAALVLALMPTGVMAASFASIHKASVATTVFCLLVTSALAPAIIPWAFTFVRINDVSIPFNNVVMTLLLVLVVPLVWGILFKRIGLISEKVDSLAHESIKYMIGFCCMCVVGQHRQELLVDPPTTLLNVAGMVLVYLSLYLFPRLYQPLLRLPHLLRTCSIISGYNNNILAVIIASLYFPKEVSAIVITAIPAGIVVVACLDSVLEPPPSKAVSS